MMEWRRWREAGAKEEEGVIVFNCTQTRVSLQFLSFRRQTKKSVQMITSPRKPGICDLKILFLLFYLKLVGFNFVYLVFSYSVIFVSINCNINKTVFLCKILDILLDFQMNFFDGADVTLPQRCLLSSPEFSKSTSSFPRGGDENKHNVTPLFGSERRKETEREGQQIYDTLVDQHGGS